MKERIGILNYGAGNFGSVQRALKYLQVDPLEVQHRDDLQNVDRLIFPGVGSAEQALYELKTRKLLEGLVDFAQSGRPLLGICVGMQVLGSWSEEGHTECLGLLPFRVEKFRCTEPVPHMGWNSIDWNSKHPYLSSATKELSLSSNFYFVHSYAAFVERAARESDFVLGTSNYGDKNFCAFVAHKNIWGAQCHIEKSGTVGLQLIRNFLNWENF